MQKRRIVQIGLSILGGMILFLSLKSEVLGWWETCASLGYECGDTVFIGCWNEYCSSSCTYGCSSESCNGGDCNSAPNCSGSTPCGTPSNCYAKYCDISCGIGCTSTCGGGVCTTANCATFDTGMCGGIVTDYADCYMPGCWSCASGECWNPDCDGGAGCIPPPENIYCFNIQKCGGEQASYSDCWDPLCEPSKCPLGCTTDTCDGGICIECVEPDNKCESGVYWNCVDGAWAEPQTCGFGCDGDVCAQSEYCEDSWCGECTFGENAGEEGYYEITCWATSAKETGGLYPRYQCVEGSSCVVEECHPVSGTCGGTLDCPALGFPGLVSHIDNCGGQDCGPPCGGGGGCVAEYPMKPTLMSPTDGGVTGESVTLSWERNGWGVGCPENSNSQSLYLEAGDSSPDVEVGSLDASVSSYNASGLESGTVYYWRVRLNNGSLSMDSDIFSFNVNGLIEGYFFDSGGMIVCPADLSDPAYDSRKIGGGLLDITGTEDYLDVTTIADGSYSQAVTIPGSYVLENFRLGAGFVSTPDLICDGSSVEFVLGGDGTAIRSFGFLRDYDGWWQAVGGDVYGGMGIGSEIPGTCTVGEGCQPYLIASDANGESGLARYLSGSIDLGSNESASVGPDGWVANSGYAGQNTNYTYYTSKMALLEKTSWGGSGKPVFNPEIGEDFEIYMYTGTATIDFDVVAGEKMIFMVGGDVDVSSDIDVAEGGHLAVIASGSITFANDVGQVEGWWVGDSLNIESTGDEGTEIVFRGEGSFVGWNGVSLNRDRGGLNATEPAEEFVFRPDLIINAPDALKFSRYVWQEKAP